MSSKEKNPQNCLIGAGDLHHCTHQRMVQHFTNNISWGLYIYWCNIACLFFQNSPMNTVNWQYWPEMKSRKYKIRAHKIDKKIVSDRRVGCCLETEGNGVNPSGGNEGGPGPPIPDAESKISSYRQQGRRQQHHGVGRRREEGSGVTKRTHRAQSEDYLMF